MTWHASQPGAWRYRILLDGEPVACCLTAAVAAGCITVAAASPSGMVFWDADGKRGPDGETGKRVRREEKRGVVEIISVEGLA